MHYLELIARHKKSLDIANANLVTKIEDVIGRLEYQPGYPKWDGLLSGLPKAPGSQAGVTWCNNAAWAIITELQRIMDMILDKIYHDINWTDPDEMYYYAVDASRIPNSDVREVTKEEAWAFARVGVPVLASAPRNGSQVGHLGVVFPTNNQKDKADPYIGQSGSVPGIRKMSESFQKYGLTPKFFIFLRFANEKIS